MRIRKPEGGHSGGIARMRQEFGFGFDKRKASLSKNKQEFQLAKVGDPSQAGPIRRE